MHTRATSQIAGSAGPGLGGFLFAALWRGRGFKGVQQSRGNGGDFFHGLQETGFVRLGGFMESGDLPDKLQRRGPDFFIGYRRIEVEQDLDISAHWMNLVVPAAFFAELRSP